jgi:hypothetical protein
MNMAGRILGTHLTDESQEALIWGIMEFGLANMNEVDYMLTAMYREAPELSPLIYN